MNAADFTLLVVDDNEENRDILSRRLERKGFTVLTAEGGIQALGLIAKQPVDLVLLDVMMPGMNGLEVLRILRETRSAADLPVIMATARSESSDVVEALELGANDYVTKPLDFPVVLARVQAQLRSRKAAPEPASPSEPRKAADVGPGTVLAGRYRIDGRIGSGSFGTVWRARHMDLENDVAVKVLQASVGRDGEALARFRREGITACRVKHPNAVTVVDFAVSPDGLAFLVMELLEGHSLLDELQRDGVLSAERAVRVLVPVCEVLAEAHRNDVLHRDIKPSNIFLQQTARGENPKVLDFGIAKIAGEATGQDLTLDGAVLGTLAYMAPERFRKGAVDGRSDVYSVGITLYQALAGRPPFTAPADDPMALVMMHVNEKPKPLRLLNPDVPPALEAVVFQALRKRADQRPTAEEMARNLARAIGLEEPAPVPAADRPRAKVQITESATQVSGPLTAPSLDDDPTLAHAGTQPVDFTPLDETLSRSLGPETAKKDEPEEP